MHNLTKTQRTWFMITLLGATFSMSISQSALATAYPSIMKQFELTAGTVQWLTTGFMLLMTIMMPISPWLLANFKFKPLFNMILLTFIIGTLMAVLAHSWNILLVGRLIEGIAVGALFPTFQSVLLAITPEAERGQVMGKAGLVMGSALATGPIVSGVVLQYLSWRALFGVFLVILILILILAQFFMRNVTSLKPYKLDWLSTVTIIGFAGLIYAINMLTAKAWSSALIVGGISIILTGIFIYRQLHMDAPLLDIKVFKSSVFTKSVFLTGISYIGLIVTTVLMPLYYQVILHLPILASGLLMVPAAVGLSLLNPRSGKMLDYLGAKKTVMTGLGMMIVGFGLLALPFGQLSLWKSLIAAMIIEGGNAFAMMPAVTFGANTLTASQIPHGTAITTTVRQMLGSLGVMVAMAILTVVSQAERQVDMAVQGFHVAFISFMIIELIGVIVTITLPNKK
ncbi:MFS transporter [Periweissella cryptocerci]|uniref:MFS transporter n=1 Tax=Periweissella cryptocerci TaxID=2506420 RepID=A0A4P6YV43_9LACO|nr:MFS transporter [Periweissella cryptocerci]QBO36674.1 MFS transporter [Periweissella cryptocerci]